MCVGLDKSVSHAAFHPPPLLKQKPVTRKLKDREKIKKCQRKTARD